MNRGYEDFVRVGCLKRIAKPILKHTLRESGADDKLDKESLKELNEMLRVTRDQAEIQEIKAAIAQVCLLTYLLHILYRVSGGADNPEFALIELLGPNLKQMFRTSHSTCFNDD
jgi:hypothetical protein